MSMIRPGFVNVENYLSLPRNPDTWLIQDLIPTSGKAILYGSPKTGKSACGIQLACALSGGSDEWLGFKVSSHGPVLYLQLDTPRSTWSLRFEALDRYGIRYNKDNLYLADVESIAYFPFDILQPTHFKYLHSIVQPLRPVAVIIDTLRKAHTGEEDNSSTMSNVISGLYGAVHPAALIVLSHGRKPHTDMQPDLMNDHRGSGAVTGEMDAVIRMLNNKFRYGGRNIEEGEVLLEKVETENVLLWKVRGEESFERSLLQVLQDASKQSMRERARALAILSGRHEDACMSILRRRRAAGTLPIPMLAQAQDIVDSVRVAQDMVDMNNS